MSPEIIGAIGIVVMLLLFAIGMPISFAMALAGVAGYAYLVSPAVGLSLLPRDIFEQFASYPLSVIPMFVLMGCYAFAAGITEQSIGKLFIAGVIPGIILAILFISTVYLICKRDPASGPVGPATTWKQKFVSLKGLLEPLILFGVTIGGLFAGWFTPTQAGAIGAAEVIVLGLINRELTWPKFVEATREGLRLSCMILLLIAGATVFGHFITRTAMPMELANWVGALDVSPVIILLLIIAFWFVMGCFIDAMALIVLLMPIILPVITNLGYDLIWFAVIVTVLSMIAVVTPPVGVNAYVVKGITENVPLTTIFRGTFPFFIPFVVGIALLIAFPCLSTFLTTFVTY